MPCRPPQPAALHESKLPLGRLAIGAAQAGIKGYFDPRGLTSDAAFVASGWVGNMHGALTSGDPDPGGSCGFRRDTRLDGSSGRRWLGPIDAG